MSTIKREHLSSGFSNFLKIAFGVFFALVGVLIGVLYAQLRELPDISNLNEFKPSQTTRIYDVNGDLVSQLWLEQRTIVPLEKVPLILQNALIATEDERYYHHWGIDFIGIIRAFINNLNNPNRIQGGSTITQQLARTLFLTREQTLTRKIREALLAIQIEKNYSKKMILEMYFNEVYFGEGAYGAESAARSYFGKHVESLTLPECALLAGLPKAPNPFDPYKHPLEALKRRSVVLDRMAAQSFITQQEAVEAKNTPIELRKIEVQNAPYFVEYVRQQLEARYGTNAVYKGGLSVYTTLDMKMQEAAQQAMAFGLADAKIRLRKNRESSLPIDQPIQGALLAIEPHSGAIRAMIGGVDYRKSEFNRAIQAHRQPGSAFKPIIYAAAIENGYTMADVFLDNPVVYPDPITGQPWRPVNYSGKFRGPTTLHTALMYSVNVVTIKLLEKLGIQPVVSLARRLGMTCPFKPNLSMGLGTSEVTLVEMVRAFSTFANQGVRMDPFAILMVKDSSGHILENNSPVGEQVLEPQVAYIMVNALKDVIDHGTGQIIRRLGFNYPAAGKTGTTSDNVDAWFIGFTPDLACGVWLGYDDRISLGHKQTGGETAAPVWAAFMKEIMAGKPPKEFEPPKGSATDIVKKKVCLDTGLLANAFCPRTRDEIFKKETAPARSCNLHTSSGGTGVLAEDDGSGGSVASPSGDILEMDAQPVIKSAPSPGDASKTQAAPGGTEDQKTSPKSDQNAYPDEGF